MDATLGQAAPRTRLVDNPWFTILLPIFGFLLVIARTFWGGGDSVGWVALLVCLGLLVHLAQKTNELSDFQKITYTLIVCLLSAGSLFFIAKSDGGVWVNTKTKETTVSRQSLTVFPFWSSVTFLETSQSRIVTVKAQTSDGIPLTCRAETVGIVLDYRDKAHLHERLTVPDNPQQHINSVLDTRIKEEIATAVNSRQNQEIAQLRQFHLPYQIGSGVQKTLSSLGLRWENGKVFLFCEVVFNN